MGEQTFGASHNHLCYPQLTVPQEKIRAHMEECIRDPDWLTDSVSEAEFRDFDPQLGPCCTADSLRLHFEGTTCDRWNKSATEVFVEDFLAHHPEYPGGVDIIRDMVHHKTRSTITSMIKEYRRLHLHPDERDAMQLRKNRLERKRGVSKVQNLGGVGLTVVLSFLIAG